MIELLIALLATVLPPCGEEDDPWCVVPSERATVVNLAPADPAPASLILPE